MNLAVLARSLAVCVMLLGTPLFASEPTVSFTRQGQDLISAASFASGDDLAFAYDASFGQMTRIGGSAYSLSLTSDPLLHLPLAQTILDASDAVLLTAAMTYEAGGLRASRMLSAGAASFPPAIGMVAAFIRSSSSATAWTTGSSAARLLNRLALML